jgi:glycosyltransferase involved in cell wall biosynthesis
MKKQKKRICIVRNGFYPHDPRVYKASRALIEAGYDVDVVCVSNSGEPVGRAQIDGVCVYRLPHIPRRNSKVAHMLEYSFVLMIMGMFLSLLHCRRRYDCIQVHTLPDILVFITVLPKLFGARILLDLHEPTPELLLTKYNGKVGKRMLQLQYALERWAIRYAHYAVTVNDTIRRRFIERGADPGRMSVVRNVPPENFGVPAVPRKPHAGFVIMTHGTLQSRYGHSVLLYAMPLIRARVDGVRLIVAGEGDSMGQLKQLTAELGCEDVVTFTGEVSWERIIELLAEVDAGIVPLLPGPFSELCQPNKLFEYIALNVPVIAVRLPAIEESFDDSCIQYFTAGDHRDLAEAIVALAQDARLRDSLAAHAFERYQTLRWSVAKKEYVRIVDTLINPADQMPVPGRGEHAE